MAIKTKVRAGALILALGLLTLGPAAGASTGQNPRHTGAHPSETTDPGLTMRVVACQGLGPPGSKGINRVVVKQNFIGDGSVSGAQVDFIAGWPGSPKTVKVFTNAYGFNDMFFEPDVLVTEWVAVDRPVVEAFHVGKGGVKLVFSKGARGGFDYWNNVIMPINAALGADGNYHPTTVDLWEWDGEEYRLLETVPYDKRLEALARVAHEPGTK